MFTFWQNQCGFGTKIMQIHCRPAGLEDQDLQTEPGLGPKIMQIHANTCTYTVKQVVWTIRIRKVRFPKLNSHRELEARVDICLIPFGGRIRIRKVRFPKLNSHREIEAFVDMCFILVF